MICMKPYSFIPFLKTNYYKGDKTKSILTGKIELTIEVLNAIHVSKGVYYMNESNVLYDEFFKIEEKYAIPGTSIKGMVRFIAEVASNSCISVNNKIQKNLPQYKFKSCKVKNSKSDCCMVCNIFGTMGKSSKIKFSNFIYESGSGEISIIGLPELKGPHIDKEHIYLNKNNEFNGYKIYNHGITSILKIGDYQCECLKEGAKFKGTILYENLDEQELELLCYALGLAGDFNHKVGYGKPAYYGSVKVSSSDQLYIDYAKNYIKNSSQEIKNNILLLEKNYSYENAKKHPDYEE